MIGSTMMVVPSLPAAAATAGRGVSAGASLRASDDEQTDQAGHYYSQASRFLDTRIGLGAPKKPLGPGGTLHLQITGAQGIPNAGVAAVAVNLTVTGGTAASSYLTVYPDGGSRPFVSNVNFLRGSTVANVVTVKVGTDGRIAIFNASGSVSVIVDVMGYYAADDTVMDLLGGRQGERYLPVTPVRILDTRRTHPLAAKRLNILSLKFGADDVTDRVRAVVVNITVVNAAGSGYISQSLAQGPSILNFAKGQTVSNMAIEDTWYCGDLIPACGNDRTIALENSAAVGVNVLVDVVGVYDDGSLLGGSDFFATDPSRILDTRAGLGFPRALAPNTTAPVTVPSAVLSVPTPLVDAQPSGVVLNLTAVRPTANTYMTVWPAGITQPVVSNQNPSTGEVVASSVYTALGTDNQFDVYNNAGTTDVLADVAGVFELDPNDAGTNPVQQPVAQLWTLD